MHQNEIDPDRIRRAWQGRISGCQLGKPVELLSMTQGREAMLDYLRKANAMPLRDYVPLMEDTLVARFGRNSCLGRISRSEPDDDINYSALALIMLEQHGTELSTLDVARTWLRLLPPAATFTAERAAYKTLLAKAEEHFPMGADPGFNLEECAENEFSDWIGAQIRADVYGWVCPGRPELAARLARQDAALSHREEGVHGAVFIAALGAAIPATGSLDEALDLALKEIPAESACAGAVGVGRRLSGQPGAVEELHGIYGDLSPVHTVNNLALVVWSLCTGQDDYSTAIGEAVAGGWDTDCNGATVGALWGLLGSEIPKQWTEPWNGRVALTLAGYGEVSLEELVNRTVAVAETIAAQQI